MESLGKYKIEAKLGQGAMGCVYKAWHPGFNDYVALKTIQDTRLEGSQLLERFKREGQALAKLKHQNIVRIYDADQADGIHFIVMEYMNGGSLDRIIEARDRSPLARRVGYIVAASHALSYAHRRGLFHRDIKPANIMLHNDANDEAVKVVDFGIARLVDPSERQDFSMSQTNMLIGAPAYMAPELLTGSGRANEQTDIWALGVTLYELIAFEKPFRGNDLDELRGKVVYAKSKPLSHIVPECPNDLDEIVERMIEKNPSRRYSAVDDLLIDLEPIAKRLRAEAAVTLVRRANELCEIGEMEKAKPILTEARKYDATNTQIRELLHRIDEELKSRELLPRLHSHLRRARDFVNAEEYASARAEIAAALSLDADFEPARKYLEEIEEAARKKEFVEEKLRLTKLRMAEGELTQAEMLLKDVEDLDSGNAQFWELRHAIDQERQHRIRRKRLTEILSRARMLMGALLYEECLALLSQALEEFPAEKELRKLHEIVRADAAVELRQQERQRAVDELRALVRKGDFEAAQDKAQQLLRRFPDDVAIQNLRAFAADGIEQSKQR
ncbi:MAG TPA: protein kinase [Candidatus Dormibacteraeota bacterium]|nr:protein kinase [Candidatus Dormibacteraeota bacterium]